MNKGFFCQVKWPYPKPGYRASYTPTGAVADPEGIYWCRAADRSSCHLVDKKPIVWNKDSWTGLLLSLMLIPDLIRRRNVFEFWERWNLAGNYEEFWEEFQPYTTRMPFDYWRWE